MNKSVLVGVMLLALLAVAMWWLPGQTGPKTTAAPAITAVSADGQSRLATFAGGCFW